MPVNTDANSRTFPFTPRLRVFTQSLIVSGDAGGGDCVERQLPVLHLAFDYGAALISATDARDGFFVAQGNALAKVHRDLDAERQAQCLLEGFGAVELSCLADVCDLDADDTEDSEAHYLVNLSDNVHSLCSFGAYAIPQLRELGWDVTIDADYPYQVVPDSAPWYADVGSLDERPDWFSLELGIDLGGTRLNLLPGLLELLDQGSEQSLSALLSTPARFRALRVGENRYVVVPPERLRKLLMILEELYDGSNHIQFERSAAASVSAIEDAFESAAPRSFRWQGARSVIDRGRTMRHAGSPGAADVYVPALRATLRPYQQQGLNWLQTLRANESGGVLADDMGLGKTLQTIAHLAKEKIDGRLRPPALVVLPTSLLGNWQRELRKFAPFVRLCVIAGPQRAATYEKISRSDVVLTTYPILTRDLAKLENQPWSYVILDEAQAIKNSRSQVKAAVSRLDAHHRLCLTGTPVENNLGELWSLFDFLMPGFLGNLQEFKRRYQGPIEKDQDEPRLLQLQHRVAPYILRRMKHTVAKDLPPKTEIVRAIELDGDQRDLYENIRVAAHADVRRMIRSKGLAASTVPILDALMKLRQVCCDPRLVRSGAARDVNVSAKHEFLMDFVQTQVSQGSRILVFSQFTQMLDLIERGLSELGIASSMLTGSTADRQARCDEFESGKTDVFLISLKAGGTGLNLTSADTVVHYDPWWNPAARCQATDRAYRIGQKKPVFVYNLIVAGSVEERMMQLQRRKQHLADVILHGQANSSWTEQDVADLLEPLPSG